MRFKKLKLSFLPLLGLSLTGLQAQEAVPASGGMASGSGGTVSYSLGQVVYTTNIGTDGTVIQGVQQPFEITVVSVIDEVNQIDHTVSAYPNPTTEFLEIHIESKNLKDPGYQLYDVEGKIIETNKIAENHANINMSNYKPATYFVKILEKNKVVKTFIIVKK